MTLTSKDLLIKELQYKIDMASGKPGALLERSFTFNTGESVSFSVRLKSRVDMTLVDLHRESLERAIEMLQAVLNPEPAQEPKSGSLASQLA